MPTVLRTDALQITDADAGPSGPSWVDLTHLADHRVVLVSLAVLASAINRFLPGTASLRVRRQHDKPTCAMVREANFITRGFALHDVFWHGWHDPDRGVYVQRQLVRSTALRRFCQGHGLVTALSSEADTDAASGHPLCLYRPGRSGFLLAMDLGPPDRQTSTRPISPYGDRLLRQALGQMTPGRGQYAVAPRCRQEFAQTMAGLGDRFTHLRWVPTHSAAGRPPFGWIETRPVPSEPGCRDAAGRSILIRTGFSPGEWDLVFGAATFLKQLTRQCTALSDAGTPRRPPRRYNRRDEYAAMPIIRWVPLACRRAVPPPARAKEYAYVIEVQPALRGRRAERLPPACVRLDVKRARGPWIGVRTSTTGTKGRTTIRRLGELSSSFGVETRAGRLARAPGGAEVWEVTLPVARDVHGYDAVAAVDRVVQVLSVLLGL